MIRTAFLQGVSASAVGALAPNVPAAAPAARSSPGRTPPPDVPGLPYDKTIGLKMRALDAPDFDLVKYRGYVVWINIFASWCPPCNHEQPDVVSIAERYYDRGLRVIGMNDEESDDTARAYRKKYRIRYPIAMDEDGGFTRALQVGKADRSLFLPAHLIFTPQGYLSYFHTGTFDIDNVTSRIEGLLTLVDPSQSPGPLPTRTPSPQVRSRR